MQSHRAAPARRRRAHRRAPSSRRRSIACNVPFRRVGAIERLRRHLGRGPVAPRAPRLILDDGSGERIDEPHGPFDHWNGEQGAQMLQSFASSDRHDEIGTVRTIILLDALAGDRSRFV